MASTNRPYETGLVKNERLRVNKFDAGYYGPETARAVCRSTIIHAGVLSPLDIFPYASGILSGGSA
jgi:hypothetical protein